MVLFAQHDLIMDPPFTRLDLLFCRNVLIYFNATLQKRLLPLFHYSLLPGGVLMLGASETVGAAQNLFPPLSSKSRLYRRSPDAAAFGAVDFPVYRRFSVRTPAPELPMSLQSPPTANVQALADHLLLQKFSPTAVLVNELGDILYISGHTGQYLEPAAGKANWNIHVMARPPIRTQPLAPETATKSCPKLAQELRPAPEGPSACACAQRAKANGAARNNVLRGKKLPDVGRCPGKCGETKFMRL